MDWKLTPQPVSYNNALTFMDERVAAIREGKAEELIWLLEHPPLYTAGTGAKAPDLLNPKFPVFQAGRGGQYTYHGPGQRIAYVMIDLKKRQKAPDIKDFIWRLEEWIIRSLAHFSIEGGRREGRVGIWLKTAEGDRKIAAIGVRVRHWVTLHGIAININPDLSHFAGIVPCGISDAGVTSLSLLKGKPYDINIMDKVLKQEWATLFEDQIVRSAQTA